MKLDHCVIHVSDWERSNAFYTDVLGAELIARPVGFAYRFGDRQLNVHGPGVAPAEVARLPVQPGNSDLCFEWTGPIADAIAHLKARRCGRTRADAALRRQGAGHQRLFPRSRRLADGIHVLRRTRVSEAPGTHDPTVLPPDIPVPQDDGAARHLPGMKLPDLALPATAGAAVNLSKLKGRTVVYVYPRTGVPGVDPPPGWDHIPGARGCTPQSCGFRDHFAELKRSASRSFSACRRRTPPISAKRRSRLHLPFAILSDEKTGVDPRAQAADLPTSGMTLLKRMALVIDDGVIAKVFYPVFPPDKSAADVVAWLQSSG